MWGCPSSHAAVKGALCTAMLVVQLRLGFSCSVLSGLLLLYVVQLRVLVAMRVSAE